jgi:hypothetical protein
MTRLTLDAVVNLERFQPPPGALFRTGRVAAEANPAFLRLIAHATEQGNLQRLSFTQGAVGLVMLGNALQGAGARCLALGMTFAAHRLPDVERECLLSGQTDLGIEE